MYFRKKSTWGFSKRTSKSNCVNRKIPQVQHWCCAQRKRPLTQFSPKPISIKAMWLECRNYPRFTPNTQDVVCHLFSTSLNPPGDLLSSVIPSNSIFLFFPTFPDFYFGPLFFFFIVPLPVFGQNQHHNPDSQALENCSRGPGLKTTQHSKHMKTRPTSPVNRKGLV